MDSSDHRGRYLDSKHLGGDMAAKTRDVAQKAERWTQAQIDAVERAKEDQRRREQQMNKQREANSEAGHRIIHSK